MKILASIINYYRAHKKCGKSLLDGMWSPPSKYKLSIIQSQYQCSDIKKRKIKSFILIYRVINGSTFEKNAEPTSSKKAWDILGTIFKSVEQVKRNEHGLK